jgi:hypothetical protein
MRHARFIAAVTACAAAGCLWLFPIEKKEKQGVAGMAGTSDMGGAAGSEVPTEDAGKPECTSNADCVVVGDFTPCTSTQKCLKLRTPDCLVVRGKWDDPHAFLFGAYSFQPPGAPEKSDPIYNFELAINELNSEMYGGGGLLGKDGNRHPLAAVICNNDPGMAASDPEFYHRTLDHLVNDLGVSAIIADVPSGVLIDDYHSARDQKKNVFFLSPGAANNALYGLDDNGLVWTMLGPPKDLADGYRDLVRRIENYIRSIDDAGATQLRVAVVVKDDSSEVDHELFKELLDAVRPKLFFNSDSATNQMGGNYREFHIGTTGDAGLPAAVGDAVNAYAPHIVISMTGTDFTSVPPGGKEGVVYRMMTLVGGGVGREQWVSHNYPFFIFSPINGAATSDFNKLLQSTVVSNFHVIYNRFLGISIAGTDDRPLYGEYLKRLRALHIEANAGFENYYDAIYYLAYAAYSQGVEQVVGSRLSTGMTLLNSGTPQKVGPVDINSVYEQLTNQGSALMIGVGGSRFEVSTGVRIDKAGLYCFERPLNGGFPLPHQPAEIYDAQGLKWNVLFECTPGL